MNDDIPTTPLSSRDSAKKMGLQDRKPVDHPKYSNMINMAILGLDERGGSSRQAILKYIVANYDVGTETAKINTRLKTALKAGVKDGSLKQSNGTGATGSFRLAKRNLNPMVTETPEPAVKKPVSRINKPAAKAKSHKKTVTKSKKTAAKPKSLKEKDDLKKATTLPAKRRLVKPKGTKAPASKTTK